MRYKEVYINCVCGGGASVKIPHEDTTAVAECACGKMLITAEGSENWRVLNEDPPVLGLSVGDEAKSKDIFG